MQSISPLARPFLARNLPLRVSTSFCAFCMVIALFAALLSTAAAAPGEIKHVVVFWLKQPGDAAARAQLIRASQNFHGLPGIVRVEVGRGLAVRRPGIEKSFDLCAIFTFRNQAALNRFQDSPEHRRAVETVLKPLVQRYAVYNFAPE